MLKKQLNNEEGNNLSEPDPELGQRSPREDAQKKEENKRTDAEPPPITKIRTTGLQKKSENVATVKHCWKKKNNRTFRGGFKKALNRHSQRGTCPETLLPQHYSTHFRLFN